MAKPSTHVHRVRASGRPSAIARVGFAIASLLPALLVLALGLARPGIAVAAPATAYLDATVTSGAAVPGGAQDLTELGVTDWGVWGYAGGGTSTSLTPDVRKVGGTSLVGQFGIQGVDPTNPNVSLRGIGQFPTAAWRFDWSDGTLPDAAATNVAAGLQWNGFDGVSGQDLTGWGFGLVFEATPQPQRLYLFTHAHGSTGRFSVSMSDPAATAFSIDYGDYGFNTPGIIAVDFSSQQPGATMTVAYQLLDQSVPNGNQVSANPAIYAFALAPQLVSNGGFESEPLATAGETRPAGNTTVTDWTIGGDSINHVRNDFWSPFDGGQSVDLAGDAAGTIEQSFSTVPGATYRLSYAFAANPQGSGASMDVFWDDDAPIPHSAVGALDPAPNTLSPVWETNVVDVVASSATTTLRFANTAAAPGPGYGMALDDVSVVPVGTNGVPVATPTIFRAAPIDGDTIQLVGLTPEPGSYDLTIQTSGECVAGSLVSPTLLGSFSVTTTADLPYFGGPFTHAAPRGDYIAATITGPEPHGSGASTCEAVQADNDSWVSALPLDVSDGAASASGFVDSAGNSRWFRFLITPGQKITVDLAGMARDYDLAVFKDISQAYSTLTSTDDLTRISAEFAPSAFAPSAFAPSAFAPSAFAPSAFAPSAFAPSAFAPSAFAPSAFAPSAFAPSAFAPSAFAPSAFAPSAFAPSAFAPSAFAPSAFAPSAFAPSAFASAQTRSLVAISALPGTGAEWVAADTWNNTGSFYVRVTGKNGEFDTTTPFDLDVAVTGTECAGVDGASGALPVGHAGGYETLILTAPDWMDASLPGNGGAAKATMADRLAALATATDGLVLDVSDDARVVAMDDQADDVVDCPYAKNLVAAAIKDIVDAERAANPGLRYIVLVGDDGVIPFFRYPDQSLLGPESDFVPPVDRTSASEASLRSNLVLGQDEYGASTTISVRGSTFPIPDLAVGRLVETAAEVSGMIDAYLATSGGVVPTPDRSLVTGYDFIADAADAIGDDLGAGLGTAGTTERLITPGHLSPQDPASWDADQLRAALLTTRHDLAFLGGHFSADAAEAADAETQMTTSELVASTVDLANSIIFSIGCHSGYNLVDPDGIAGVTQTLDWPQAFARKGATLIAGTGYQYGDTDFIEYSERLYLGFAQQLRTGSGPVAVGEALAAAKRAYLTITPDPRGLHEKALLQATVFGLPMLKVDLPGTRLPAPDPQSDVPSTTPYASGPGFELGLTYADLHRTPSLDDHQVVLEDLDGGPDITATYYTGPNGNTTNPAEPALPLDVADVTVDGQVLRGVGFRGGDYTDLAGPDAIVPLTGAPNTEIRGVHIPFSSTVFYPMRLATPNYFDALGDGGRTNLLLTPLQHRTEQLGALPATARVYDSLDVRLFYSDRFEANPDGSNPGLAAAPTISEVSATVDDLTVSFRAKVVGDPAAGIQQVWATFTGHTTTWQSVDLVQDALDSTLWTGSLELPSLPDPAALRFMVQAVNGVGLVSVADDLGAYYAATVAGNPVPDPAAASLSLEGSDTTATFGSTVHAVATLDSDGPVEGKAVVFSLGGATRIATTDEAGVAEVDIDVTAGGSLQLTATFAGDAGTAGATASSTVSVDAAATSLDLQISGPEPGTIGVARELSARLTSGTSSIGGRTVAFTVALADGTTVVLTDDTDFGGVARVAAPVGIVGIHAVTAAFGSIVPVPGGAQIDLTDPLYEASTDTLSYQVIWPYSGFFAPVDNGSVVNAAKPGSTIPVKFSLGGDRGLQVIAAGYPKVTKYACETGAVEDVIETTSSSASGLTYDAVTGVYQYNWKTAKSLKGCYTFELKLIDGTLHTAKFSFK